MKLAGCCTGIEKLSIGNILLHYKPLLSDSTVSFQRLGWSPSESQ